MSKPKLWVLFSLILLLPLISCRPRPILPDLVVQNLNVGSITVSCPGGSGTCVTTVTFTIANTGVVSAGAFNVKITFDPNQAVTVNLPVAGLVAGASQTFTVTSSPPGDNCFDPDCTICVTVDDGNAVTESDETNNQNCCTRRG